MRDDLPTTPIILDIETAGLPNAADYLEPVTPDGRLTDPVKIKADITAKESARFDKLPLDWNVARIAVIGWWTAETDLTVRACRSELEEIVAIANFWDVAKHRTMIGFNLKGFDLRFLVQRSRFLGITHPTLDFSPYSSKGSIVDLFLELTFRDGPRDQGAMRRTLTAFCRRFGIPCDDPISGKDVPALIAAGKWDEAMAHCAADVTCTRLLAERLGYVRSAELAAVI